jgi:cytochrome P450
MGIAYDDVDQYIEHLWGMLHQYDLQLRFKTAQEMIKAAKEIYERNVGVAGDGLFNAFINSQIGGERPTPSQSTGFILFQLLAGLDTMGTTASWALHHLADRPDLQKELSQDPAKIPSFLEEIFRRYAILATNRFVTKDYEIDGVVLKAGDNVLLAASFACMDATHFECPAEVRPGRRERHLAFGAGPHFCIGAPMARMQVPIFLEEWLRKIPSFRRQEGAKTTAHTGDLTGLDTLQLEWPV